MSDLKVCRICLRTKGKMYHCHLYQLKLYYEEVMAIKVNEKDGLPNYFCYECAAMLYKFHKFKEKCWTGQKTLKELLWSGSINLSSISQIDRQGKSLQSPIDILSVSKRVRTCIINSKSLIKEIKNVGIEKCKVNYDSDSDNSLDNKNLSEIKNTMINEKSDSIIEDEKTYIDTENINSEEKALPDFENDRMFSDEVDEDSNPESENEVDKPEVKEEFCDKITIEEEKIKFNTEQANSVNDVDNLAIKEEFSNDTIKEEKIISMTEQANSDDGRVPNKNNKEKELKKTITNKDLVDKKVKKFEVSDTKKNFLDPNHWLKINLNEDEALEEFRARAQDRKYLSAAYQCTDCYKGFSKEDMLNRHNKLRHSESVGPVKCRFCNMRFKTKCRLTSHITQYYTKYKCLRCDLICPLKSTALFHNDYHNGVIRKCMHCEEEFRHLSTYYTHLRTHRSEHVCTLCGASFVSTKGLNKHKMTMHINTIVNPEEEVNTYCERCDIMFETRKAYEEHLFHSAKHAEGVEDLQYDTPTPSIPEPKKICLRRNPRQLTPCTICNRNFSTRTAYMRHHAAEHKNEPLPTITKQGKKQICEICGASISANIMSNHLNTHTREKLYTCSICHKQFNSKGSMNRHQLTHSSEKPVACTLCDKRFKQISNMKLHYRTFHLKEPYPKRNRRKNAEIQLDLGSISPSSDIFYPRNKIENLKKDKK